MSEKPLVLRYVILHHQGIPDPHFDLMFQEAAHPDLRTFRIPTWPITSPTKLIELPRHRSHYLDYQGPISNNRGQVTRIQSGTYQSWPQWDDPCVFDLWLLTPQKQHLWLLAPPSYDWTLKIPK